jgi:hypothetical protein
LMARIRRSTVSPANPEAGNDRASSVARTARMGVRRIGLRRISLRRICLGIFDNIFPGRWVF